MSREKISNNTQYELKIKNIEMKKDNLLKNT